jgi:hypothetical protein
MGIDFVANIVEEKDLTSLIETLKKTKILKEQFGNIIYGVTIAQGLKVPEEFIGEVEKLQKGIVQGFENAIDEDVLAWRCMGETFEKHYPELYTYFKKLCYGVLDDKWNGNGYLLSDECDEFSKLLEGIDIKEFKEKCKQIIEEKYTNEKEDVINQFETGTGMHCIDRIQGDMLTKLKYVIGKCAKLKKAIGFTYC